VLEYHSLHCTSGYVRNVSQTINKLINTHWERLWQTIQIFLGCWCNFYVHWFLVCAQFFTQTRVWEERNWALGDSDHAGYTGARISRGVCGRSGRCSVSRPTTTMASHSISSFFTSMRWGHLLLLTMYWTGSADMWSSHYTWIYRFVICCHH
jgi:hypothetical protein